MTVFDIFSMRPNTLWLSAMCSVGPMDERHLLDLAFRCGGANFTPSLSDLLASTALSAALASLVKMHGREAAAAMTDCFAAAIRSGNFDN